MSIKIFTKTLILLSFIIFVFLMHSCKKDPDPPDDPPVLQDGGVYIINEGNFQWSNGSIDYYRFADSSLTTGIFESVNQRPLGDVVQSITVYNGYGYIVVNNSGKVEVVNMTNFSSAGVIDGLTSPRYLLPIGNNLAYVSDLYSNAISIVDLGSLEKTGQVALKGSSEEMLLAGQSVFVTNTRSNYVYIVDILNHTVSDSIELTYASHSIRRDKDGNMWAMCAGDQLQSVHAGLFMIEPEQKQVLKSFDLGNAVNIWDKMTINGSGEIIYFLNSGVWKINITDTQLPGAPLISQESMHFQGIGCDPETGNIYVSDAMDYVQNGRVYRYQPDGSLINYFNAGIIPSGFYNN